MNIHNTRKQDAWLKVFCAVGTIRGACAKTKIPRETVRLWRKTCPEFKQKFEEAELEVTELLEDSAVRDALDGDTVTRIFLLKARKPEKYRETSNLNLTTPVPLNITLSDDRGTDEPPKT